MRRLLSFEQDTSFTFLVVDASGDEDREVAMHAWGW